MIDPEHDPVKEGTVERLSHGVPYRPSLNESEERHFDLIIKPRWTENVTKVM